MYKVIVHFIDKDNIPYYPNDLYPNHNTIVDVDHINYLLSDSNKLSRPVIELINNSALDINDKKSEEENGKSGKGKKYQNKKEEKE